jgi:hypothetical protein
MYGVRRDSDYTLTEIAALNIAQGRDQESCLLQIYRIHKQMHVATQRQRGEIMGKINGYLGQEFIPGAEHLGP